MKNMSFEWIEDKFIKSSASDIAGGDQDKIFCCSSAKEVDQLHYRIEFCAHHMTKSLENFQAFVNARNKDHSDNDPEVESVLISIAEMKKIRDILKGTIAFENIWKQNRNNCAIVPASACVIIWFINTFLKTKDNNKVQFDKQCKKELLFFLFQNVPKNIWDP